jgi:hypothetical protein
MVTDLRFALSWYLTSLFALIFGLFFLTYLSFDQQITGLTATRYQLYKALPAENTITNQQVVEINKLDARSLIIKNFFLEKKSPLADFADTFVSVADKYKLDYRLLPSIAMQESNGGKIMPKESFNPFGYGIYGKTVLRFPSFAEAIERVGRGLKTDYYDIGLKTPEQIMPKYTPPSKGSWAMGVSTFMEELQ